MTWELRTFAHQGFYPTWQNLTPYSSGLRISMVIPGGVQTISFRLADDYIDAYRWAYDHIGSKIYVFDNLASRPVAEGVIFEPTISESGNQVVAQGPWGAYLFNQVYNNTASWITAGQTGAQIEDMLTTECPEISSDMVNVDEPGTNNFPWQPSDNSYPGDLIEYLASLSDVNNAQWYFWLQSRSTIQGQPQAPEAWFKPANEVPGLFMCRRRDMRPGGLTLTPSLRQLANDVRVMWLDATGIQNQTGSAADAASQTRFGLRERWDYDLGKAPATAADQYRDLILAQTKDPQQSASFSLNTRLMDRWGGTWPLWRLIAEFPVKFSVMDLIPDNTLLSYILDNKRTFITLAAEYDYDSNTLRIVPDTEDNRADAMLARYRGLQ